MIQFLSDEGANFEIDGEVAPQIAAYCGHLEDAQSLILSGVDVNVEADHEALDWCSNCTILQNAVSGGKIGMVKFFLNAGSDFNAMNHQEVHQTALQIAVREVANSGSQKLKMVQVLLAAGVDVNIPKEL